MLSGGTNAVVLRAYALGVTCLGLLAVYLLLRRAFPPWASLVGPLLLWSHPLVVRHAFEARFYGT